jgi:ribosomal-protein-alanine N-acetyltransferase
VLPEGYHIRDLRLTDAEALAEAYRRNREHLAPWEPTRPESWFTAEGQATAVLGQLAGVQQGLHASWVLTHGDQVVGRMNLNNIVLGVMRSASLGYWVDGAHLRRGLAAGAVEHACAEARARGLHRVEAGTLLHNEASQRVLASCGFEEYGTARQLLFLGGAWRDHRMFQRILHDDPL